MLCSTKDRRNSITHRLIAITDTNISHHDDTMKDVPGSIPGPGARVLLGEKNLTIYIRDCVSLCLSDETLKALGPFYLVSLCQGK